MPDILEGFSFDTSPDDLPEEVTQDDLWQLAHVIEQQTDWVMEHAEGPDVHSQLRNQFRQMQGAAHRAKEMRQESVERRLEGEEAQTTLMEAGADE